MEIVVISQNERQVCLRCREKNSAHKLIRICSHRVLEPSGHQQLQLQLITTTYNYERNEVTLSGLQEDILYHVEITCLMSIDGAHKYQTSAAKFFAVCPYDQSELQELYGMAENYISSRLRTYEVVHTFKRTKPAAYFNEILSGDGLMKVYIKDCNGDPRSPINHRLSGLFFEPTMLRTPFPSPYGDFTLKVCSDVMFNDNMNLYFADFYCMKKQDSHIVSLVLTQKHSAADNFCQKYLHQIDNYCNPFIRLASTGNISVIVASGVRVEILYCNDVHVSQLIKDGKATHHLSRSSKSRHNGMMKPNYCRHCNITIAKRKHAIGPSEEEQEKFNSLFNELHNNICITE